MNKGKMLVMLVVAAMLAFSATGCKESKQEPKTVDWYMKPENKQALEERLQVCRNNPGQLKDDPDCINAAEARHRLFASPPSIQVR